MVFAIHWHESAMDLHVFPIPIPPPASLSIPSLWVFLVHQPWAFASCIQPGLVLCFTLDSILVSVLLSLNIPPSPSPTESKHWGNQIWKRHLYLNVHHSTVYNSQDLEATQMPISGQMGKEAVVHNGGTQWNITQPLKRIHLNQF